MFDVSLNNKYSFWTDVSMKFDTFKFMWINAKIRVVFLFKKSLNTPIRDEDNDDRLDFFFFLENIFCSLFVKNGFRFSIIFINITKFIGAMHKRNVKKITKGSHYGPMLFFMNVSSPILSKFWFYMSIQTRLNGNSKPHHLRW